MLKNTVLLARVLFRGNFGDVISLSDVYGLRRKSKKGKEKKISLGFSKIVIAGKSNLKVFFVTFCTLIPVIRVPD